MFKVVSLSKKIKMYNGLLHAHSGLRWIVLLLIIYAIVNAFLSQNKGAYTKKDKMINLLAMIFLHIQVLLGLSLYFISPKVTFAEGWMSESLTRFYGIEHIFGMLLAAVIITMGRSKAEKKLKGTRGKHRKILTSYLLGLFIILVTIPWPFRGFGAGWM